mmetsp:Transcript_63008/g.132986  ORF Transcript_63008/g.132986 Transcript_63008/m.132986 type:complete len:387 (+) Transcript_63008:47-1207(+)
MTPALPGEDPSKFQYTQLHGVETGGQDWVAYRDMQPSNNVSATSPDWMKSAFNNNRRHFEDIGPRPRSEVGDKPYAGSSTTWIGRGPALKKTGMSHQETGKVFSAQVVSMDAPEFMKSPFESNRDFLTKEGRVKVQVFDTNAAKKMTKGERAAGIHSEHRRGDWLTSEEMGKHTNVVQEATGRICNATITSIAAPAFMKSPFETHRAYFEKIGVVQQLKPSVGPKEHEGVFGHNVGKSKRLNLAHEDGRIYNGTIVSRDAPHFMKSPFESNRAHFTAAGVAQKLKPTSSAREVGERRRAAGISTMMLIDRKLGPERSEPSGVKTGSQSARPAFQPSSRSAAKNPEGASAMKPRPQTARAKTSAPSRTHRSTRSEQGERRHHHRHRR